MNESFRVVFMLYPDVTQLDFTGPYEVFAQLPGAECVLGSAEGGTLVAAGGLRFTGVARLADIAHCALLCVPGGFGTAAAMGDPRFLSELRRLAGSARYVTSVCTGSLLLAAAGLLAGKRAACHWAWRDSLALFGAKPDPDRVVRDGNIFTGGGVTAGIDMALAVVAEIAGPDFAEATQLGLEYAPMPPFDSGSPERARPEVLAAVKKQFDARRGVREAALAAAAEALGRRRSDSSPA